MNISKNIDMLQRRITSIVSEDLMIKRRKQNFLINLLLIMKVATDE
jgi:hypothetical protein